MEKKDKSIEDKYKVLDQISHVILRPQTYIGSNKPNTSNKYIYSNELSKIAEKEITYIPSFLKIFDEILINSVDEHIRNPKLNKIDIIVDKTNNTISVKDNGGIQVELHKEHNQYVPEVIFGNLMSGSNFEESDNREVSGLNGFGQKLTNIFSTEFKISTCDGKKRFIQTFSNNMRDRNKPTITKSKDNHTEIIYKPDLEKFGLTEIDEDHYKMIEKRIYDVAACNPRIKISFNNKLIDIKSFEDYIKLYTDDYFIESSKDFKWSVGVAHSNNGFRQVSFCNSTETYDGGTHVDYIMNQIITQLRDFFNKKHKVDIKPSELKNHIFLFLNATVINPSFSSQTKEKLITEVKEFGFKFEISDKIIKSILKSEIVDSILDWIQQKKSADESKLKRELNKKVSNVKVDKLIDAKGKDRWKCSLGIFEGDCLHEDTEIRVLRDGDLLDIPIKDANIDDMVITHNNRFNSIYALTKKIKYKSIIKTKIGDIITSKDHKLMVYDIIKNEFYWLETKNIDKTIHKLVKNQLAFTESLLIIDSKTDNSIQLGSGQIIETNPTHKFAVYNRIENKFEMVSTQDLDKDIHSIVNTK